MLLSLISSKHLSGDWTLVYLRSCLIKALKAHLLKKHKYVTIEAVTEWVCNIEHVLFDIYSQSMNTIQLAV